MTQPIIKPTVGRVVWFHPSEFTGEAGFARHQDGQPYAAIIARVWSNTLVNLTVFDANGAAHSRTSVPLVQDGGGAPQADSYCEWMPYQKGQAAKTEAAEKSATEAQPAYHQRTQREELEYTLVAGAASHLAQRPDCAAQMAKGIKTMLDALHPQPGYQVKASPAAPSVTDEMVGRFLSWPLPEDFAPDCGITFTRSRHAGMNPTGTNLLHFGQARAMLEHCLGVAAAPVTLPVIDHGSDSLEREIQAKASAGPRVTPEDIEAEIVSEWYINGGSGVVPDSFQPPVPTDHPLHLLTFCVLVLRNGFTVTGESACASPENFNAEIGRKIARENAINKVWPLLGFRLRDKLAG